MGFVGCAVGSVVLLGAGAGVLLFGSVGATMDNLMLMNAFGGTQALGPGLESLGDGIGDAGAALGGESEGCFHDMMEKCPECGCCSSLCSDMCVVG